MKLKTILGVLVVCLLHAKWIAAEPLCSEIIISGNPEYPPVTWNLKRDSEIIEGIAIELAFRARGD